MPEVTVDHSCSVGPAEAFKIVRQLFETDEDLRRFAPDARCAFDESSLSGTLTADRVSVSIAVSPADSGSRVSVSVDLPPLLALFRGKVLEVLHAKLKQHLS
jgi:hypothetical protein